jgi:hypothetical protein
MIQHKENGLLVANQDVEKLSEAMNLLKTKIYIDIASKCSCKSVQSFSVFNKMSNNGWI